MSRSHVVWVAICLLVLSSVAFADSNVPNENTRAAIKSYVEAAAKVIAKNGPSCAEFAEEEWRSGDYYIFVTGPDDKELCHPNKDMIGKSASEIVDSNGKKVGLMLLEAGKKPGGGWVDYSWPRPGTTKPVAKSSYSMSVKGPDGKTYYVGSGGYELK
jgi:cytochrome c